MGLSEGKRTWIDANIFVQFNKALKFGALCNREYETKTGGKLKYNETVKIIEIAKPSRFSYTGSSITYTAADAAAFELKVDQSEGVAISQDDLDQLANNEQAISNWTMETGQELADGVDEFIAKKYTDAGSTYGSDTTAIALTAALTVSNVTLAIQALKENNVPDGAEIVAVVPPWFKTKLIDAGVKWDTNNTGILKEGMGDRFLGVDFYVSNNIQRKTGETGGNFNKIMFFVRNKTIALAHELFPFEEIRLENYFSTGWRQLSVYGAKVVRPSSLYTLTATETAETTI